MAGEYATGTLSYEFRGGRDVLAQSKEAWVFSGHFVIMTDGTARLSGSPTVPPNACTWLCTVQKDPTVGVVGVIVSIRRTQNASGSAMDGGPGAPPLNVWYRFAFVKRSKIGTMEPPDYTALPQMIHITQSHAWHNLTVASSSLADLDAAGVFDTETKSFSVVLELKVPIHLAAKPANPTDCRHAFAQLLYSERHADVAILTTDNHVLPAHRVPASATAHTLHPMLLSHSSRECNNMNLCIVRADNHCRTQSRPGAHVLFAVS